jgi:hypothetical protein
MIDNEATFEKFGYYANDLPKNSSRKIIAICDDCGKVREVKFSYYYILCIPCKYQQKNILIKNKINIKSRFKSKLKSKLNLKPKFIKEEDRFIPNTQIDRILTIEKFGYDPLTLKGNLNKNICLVCKNCKKIRYVKYRYQYKNLCQLCSVTGKNSSNWNGGTTNNKYCHLFNNEFKESIRERFSVDQIVNLFLYVLNVIQKQITTVPIGKI